MTIDDGPLPDAALGPVLRLMDVAIIEWLPDGSYAPLAPSPAWFRGPAPWSAMPFLEHFASEARRALHDSVSAISEADQFAAQSADDELLLRVRAVKLARRLILVIERLAGSTDPRPVLREARERALGHEQLVEQARAMHAPIDAVAAAATALASTPGVPPPALEALARSVEGLKQAAAALPEPRKRR
jgi:hypothetical protein